MLESTALCESFLTHLVENEIINTEAALEALNVQRRQTPAIGRIAISNGYLTMKQVFATLGAQADSGLRFGEQAVQLGYLTPNSLEVLLNEQQDIRPGIGGILYDLGHVRKGVLQKGRRAFLRTLEAQLV